MNESSTYAGPRVTADQVADAYEKTGLMPITEEWDAGEFGACGLTAVCRARGYEGPIEENADAADALSLSEYYVNGWIKGFDGADEEMIRIRRERIVAAAVMNKQGAGPVAEFDAGLDDGRAAALRVFEAEWSKEAREP